MAITNVPKTDTFDAWRIKTNTIASELGDNAVLVANSTLSSTNAVDAILEVLSKEQTEVGTISALTTSSTNLVGAINEHDVEIGTISSLTTTNKTNLVSAINELDAEHGVLSTLTTSAKSTLVSAINELDAEHGVLSTLTTTAKNTFVAAINELDGEHGVMTSLTTSHKTTLVGAINEHDTEIGTITSLTTTAKSNLVAAINELDGEHGTLSSLTTTAKSTFVAAINELDAEHGVLSTLNTTSKSTFVSAINEVNTRDGDRFANSLKLDLTNATVGGSNSSTQEVKSNVLFSGSTVTMTGTLDLSNGDILLGGGTGTLNISNTYLTLGDTAAATPSSGGIIISRGTSGGTPREDVRVFWDESTSKWRLKKFDDASGTITPFIWDSYNIKDMVVSNTENGIAVTYDSGTNKFNFDVNDFTVTLTGDVTGSGTVTNLANVSIATTIAANSVALGTDTTGNYVATIVNSDGLTLTGNSGESAAVTIGVDSTVIRTTGNQSIGGIKTFTSTPVFSTGITTSAASTLFSATVTNGLTTGTTLGVGTDLTVGGNATITGNLTVNGTVTTFNTETINLADNIISLNSNYSGSAPTENAGIEVNRGTLAKPSVYWNETEDKWYINNTSTDYALIGNISAGAGLTGGGQGPSITISHADTSTAGNVAIDNSNGTVIQDITVTLDTFGHVTALSAASYDLDNRYYTETEADSRFVNATGDAMTGDLTFTTAGVSWAANSDTATIKFESTGDGSSGGRALSNLVVTVGDNGDEGFKVVSLSGATPTEVFYVNGSQIQYKTNTVWHSANDGTGSGLDADILDGMQPATANTASTVVARDASGNFSAGTITATLSGNASTASSAAKWTTARTITLGGDLTGNVSIDGSANVTLSAQVADDSHNHVIGNIDNFTEEVQDIVGAMFDPPNIENGISVYYNDVDGKIQSDVNDFDITLTGAVTGSGTVNNLGNVSITTTLDTNSAAFSAAVKALLPRIYNVSGVQVFPTA